MKKHESTQDKIIKKINDSLNSLDEQRKIELLKAIKLLESKNSALEAERNRLLRKYGNNHPQVKIADERIACNIKLLNDLDFKIKLSSIKVGPININSWCVHGRILDDNMEGIKGLIVSLNDGNNEIIKDINETCTDNLGYFSITYTPKKQAHKISEDKSVYIVVTDSSKKVLHHENKPLYIRIGQIDYLEIVITNKDNNMPHSKINEEEKKPRDNENSSISSELWIVNGKVVDIQGKGIPGLIIILYDKDLIFDDKLGTTKTDDKGNFKFIYRTEDFRDLVEKNPDLYIKILDRNEKVLYSSKKNVRYEAGHEENIVIKIKIKENK